MNTLPFNRNKWPHAWYELWEERAGIIEFHSEVKSREKAERLAEAIVREQYLKEQQNVNS